jgi:hypothetical protein
MSLRSSKVVLLFGGVPEMPSLEAAAGCVTLRVNSALEAARAMANWVPEMLVVRGDVPWQRAFVDGLAPHLRPRVLVVGGGAPELPSHTPAETPAAYVIDANASASRMDFRRFPASRPGMSATRQGGS